MSPWIETLGVVVLGGLGALAGIRGARWRRPHWLALYLAPLGFFLACALVHRFRHLEFLVPFCWLELGRAGFAVKAFAGTLLLSTPLAQLPLRRDRLSLGVLLVVIVLKVSAWPVLAPAFNRAELAALQTRFDAEGICRQNTDYTCGPAAAVTALRRLGLEADEGELARRCRSSDAAGTPPAVLCAALQDRYAAQGLRCEYRRFIGASSWPREVPTLALMRFSFLLDHWVAVLAATDQGVTLGDPLLGKRELTWQEFDAQWWHVGIVLRRGALLASSGQDR